LRDKVVAFQTKCATTQVNLSRGKEGVKSTRRSPKSSPDLACTKAKKESPQQAKFFQEGVILRRKRKFNFSVTCE